MSHAAPTSIDRARRPVRLIPVMHIQTGETVTLFAETDKRFEERAVFGSASPVAESAGADASPAHWLADYIEDVAEQAHCRTLERPVIVGAPIAALSHPDVAAACDAAIRRTRLCPQEICIEVFDAELALPGQDARKGIEALRQVGFRVSLNATRSCEAPLSSALRLLLDNIRIDARHLAYEPKLEQRVEAAHASGMSVIAENASWRDGDYLASMGIEYALRPKTDA